MRINFSFIIPLLMSVMLVALGVSVWFVPLDPDPAFWEKVFVSSTAILPGIFLIATVVDMHIDGIL